jgi:hypothetical protein
LVGEDAGEVAAAGTELCVVDGEEGAVVWEADVEKLCTLIYIFEFYSTEN